MMTEFRTVAPYDTLGDVSRLVLAGFQHDFPVAEDGRLMGLLLRDDLFAALRSQGPDTPVGTVMRQRFPVAAPDELVDRMLRRVQFDDGPSSIPVLEHGRLVGLVTAENVGEFVMLSAALAGRRR
jgi:CBS domain-containing protein